jgi:hypothetical protein
VSLHSLCQAVCMHTTVCLLGFRQPGGHVAQSSDVMFSVVRGLGAPLQHPISHCITTRIEGLLPHHLYHLPSNTPMSQACGWGVSCPASCLAVVAQSIFRPGHSLSRCTAVCAVLLPYCCPCLLAPGTVSMSAARAATLAAAAVRGCSAWQKCTKCRCLHKLNESYLQDRRAFSSACWALLCGSSHA